MNSLAFIRFFVIVDTVAAAAAVCMNKNIECARAIAQHFAIFMIVSACMCVCVCVLFGYGACITFTGYS